jgi:haloalkane dehalogenase
MMDRRHLLGLAAGLVGAATLPGALRAAGRGSMGGVLDANAFHEMRRFASTASGGIAYVERGSGPAALFVHGFPLNGFQWRGALERLSPVRRCIAPDLLGLGFTRVADGQGVDPDSQVSMLVAFLDVLDVDSVDLVASASGGAIAQLLMVRHPRRMRTLLLANCDTGIDSPPAALQPVIELARQGACAGGRLARWHQDPASARLPGAIGDLCYADAAHPTDDAVDMYFGPLLSTHRRAALANAHALALARNPLAGIEPELRRSRVPARIVWGRADPVFLPANAEYLDCVLGGSRGVRWLQDARMFWPEERPDVLAEEARRLWNA